MHYLHFKVMADALSKYLINVIYNFGTKNFRNSQINTGINCNIIALHF